MSSRDQLMMVAVNCPGYEPLRKDVTNTIGAENSKSCDNCHNWQEHRCVVNLFDQVLTSLDQT